VLPGFDDIDLKQDGESIEVTLENLSEYIELYCIFFFDKTIKQ